LGVIVSVFAISSVMEYQMEANFCTQIRVVPV